MEQRQVTQAVVYMHRASFKMALRNELKKLGIGEIWNPESPTQCLEDLASRPDALLILDWELGYGPVAEVLRGVAKESYWEAQPIMLMMAKEDEQAVAVVLEFGAAKVHVGQDPQPSLSQDLQDLVREFTRRDTVRADLLEVMAFRSQNKWDKAGTLLKDLLQRYPDFDQVSLEWVVQLIHQNDWDSAASFGERIALANPLNLRAQNLYARCLMKKGEWDQAIIFLEQAKLINPLNPDRLVELGRCLLQVSRIKEAHDHFAAALRLEPQLHNAALGVGVCRLVAGDINEGLALLRSMSTPEEIASVFNQAGIISMRQKRFENGLQLYNTAVGALGDAPPHVLARLLFNMAVGYFRWNKFDKAREFFEKAFSLDSTFKKAQHNLKVLNVVLLKDHKPKKAHFEDVLTADGAAQFEDEVVGF